MSSMRAIEIHCHVDGHETEEARAAYADQARHAGVNLALHRIHQGRAGRAVLELAQAVERQMAIHGLAGVRIPVATQMARLTAAHRGVDMQIPTSYEVAQ